MSSTTSAPPPAGPEPTGPPYRAELPSGSFSLAARTAQRLTFNQRLTFALSVGSQDLDSGLSIEAGFRRGTADASPRHAAGIDGRVFHAPLGAAAQADDIDALVASGGADCLVVSPPPESLVSQVLDDAIDRAVDAGVPVFTAGGDRAGSRRLASYGLDDFSAGVEAGAAVGRWAIDGRILLRKAGVLSGDATDPRHGRLMDGFIAGITAALPDIELVDAPGSAESLGFDFLQAYERFNAWFRAHSDVDIVFVTDESLEAVASYIADNALYGEVSAVGLHMSDEVQRYIQERVVVAAMVANHAGQGAAAAAACSDFLLAGTHRTGAVVVAPVAVTEENVSAADWTLAGNR